VHNTEHEKSRNQDFKILQDSVITQKANNSC